MSAKEIIDTIQTMEDKQIVRLLYHDHFIVKTRAICEAVRRRIRNEDLLTGLEAAEHDDRSFWNEFLVRDFAVAAQIVLGLKNAEQYGSQMNDRIKRLTDSKLAFFED